MALTTYRYQFEGPSTAELEDIVSGATVMDTLTLPVIDVQVDDSLKEDLDTAMRSFGFVFTTGAGEAFQSLGSAVLFWSSAQTWSDILDQINAVPDTNGVVVMVAPGTYTMDVAANLDRVKFIGMGAPPSSSSGVNPVTINVVSPFTLLGNFLYIDCIAMFVDTTIWTGGGRLQLRLEGSSFLSPLNGSSPKAIALPINGVMDVAAGEFSLLAGNSAPVPFIELGDGSTLNILCTGTSIIGDFTAALASGAIAATANSTVDTTCVVSAAAFGAGITTQVFPNGTPAFQPYTPALASNWSPVPTNLQDALDQIAARLTAGGL